MFKQLHIYHLKKCQIYNVKSGESKQDQDCILYDKKTRQSIKASTTLSFLS